MKIQHLRQRLAAIVIPGLFSLTASAAPLYDATTEFSAQNNPNGVWSYGLLESDFTQFTLFETANPNGDGWLDSGRNMAIWRNDRGHVENNVPTGWLSMSPGENGEVPVLRWTAPEGVSGRISVDGEFLAGDSGDETALIFAGGVYDPENILWESGDAGAFHLTLDMAPGDILNFAIHGEYFYGNTPLSVTVESVPEPVAADLFLLAGTGLVALHYRRPR